ncbi:hypothetical protein U9M48_020817 [Paspalum notatum var. saurae]|uniref:Uncharacterized protein n=1 Tax=Paspalum notatum var. saurae TaxID=547442 RepID=A0AAQ3WSE7_PASNO
MGKVIFARQELMKDEDLFSETCRRNSFCLCCNCAFCSHCCFYHHVHDWGGQTMAKVGLDAGGRPVFPTHTVKGVNIMQCMVEEMVKRDYTARLVRDAFCLYCAKSFCADVCSHHDHHRRLGLPGDAVLRVEQRGGRPCVRCTGTEWWTSHMDMALGDPVHEGVDEQGRYYELLPVLRRQPGTCMQCGIRLHWDDDDDTHCSHRCADIYLKELDERRRRREARHAALRPPPGNN